jgi:protease I
MKRLTIFAIIFAGLAAICFSQYSSRALPRKIFQLTDPRSTGPLSFEQALTNQRIVRKFTNQPLKNNDIGQLAWAAMNITETQNALPTASLTTEQSSPIELYFATQDGVFVYQPKQHSLEQTDQQDIRNALTTAASMQQAVLDAPCDAIVAGSVKRLAEQFQNDARKYMLLLAGHVAQNLQLQAVCMGLGSVTIGGFNTRSVSKACKLPRELEPLYIISVGYPAADQNETSVAVEQTVPTVKRAVLIAASQNFQDNELFETMRILEQTGVRTIIASTRLGIITSMLGNTAEARITMNQLRVDDYDAIIFTGGLGAAVEYFNNPAAINIAREAVAKGKVLAAISVGPSLLADAGVLKGVKATGFISERERLVQAGAVYTGNPVERSGLIITGSSRFAAVPFAQAVANTLAGR